MAHRYQQHVDAMFAKALDVIKQKIEGTDPAWRQVVAPAEKTNAIAIFQHDIENHPTGILRGEGTYTGFDSNQWIAIARNPDIRKKWDKVFESARTVEPLTGDTVLAYTVMKGFFPASARDLTVCLRYGLLEDGSKYFFATSVVDPSQPEVSGKVRAHLEFAIWTLRDVPGDVTTTEVSYTTQSDPRGTIPGFLLKMVSNEVPQCVHNVYNLLKSGNGAPYFINAYDVEGTGDKVEGLLIETNYDNDSKVFKVNASYQGAAGGLVTSFLVDAAFGAGGKFVTEGDVELNWTAVNTTKTKAKLVKVDLRAAKEYSSATKITITVSPNSGAFKIVANGSELTVA